MEKLHFSYDALQYTRNSLRELIHNIEIGETKSLSTSISDIEKFSKLLTYILLNAYEYELLDKLSDTLKPLSRSTPRQKALSILRGLSKELEGYEPPHTIKRVTDLEASLTFLTERFVKLIEDIEKTKFLRESDFYDIERHIQKLGDVLYSRDMQGLLQGELQDRLNHEAKFSPHVVGEIKLFAGHQPPKGWDFCHGQLLDIRERFDLFLIIGTTYGGDGEKTFALPDLRGRVPVGASERDHYNSLILGTPAAGVTIALSEGNDNNQLSYFALNYIICLGGSNPERDD